MKNGRVSRMKLLVPSKVFCAAAINGATPLIRRNISEPSSIAKLTGKPEQHRQQECHQHDAERRAIAEMQRGHRADRIDEADQQRDHGDRREHRARADRNKPGARRANSAISAMSDRQRQHQPRRIDLRGSACSRSPRSTADRARRSRPTTAATRISMIDADRKRGPPARREMPGQEFDRGVMPGPKRQRAADERGQRQEQLGGLIGPQQRFVEPEPRDDAGQHDDELDHQRDHQNARGTPNRARSARRGSGPRPGRA